MGDMIMEALEDGRLSAAAVDNVDFTIGRNLLSWIEAYGMAAGKEEEVGLYDLERCRGK
jgi:hypothetical protein